MEKLRSTFVLEDLSLILLFDLVIDRIWYGKVRNRDMETETFTSSICKTTRIKCRKTQLYTVLFITTSSDPVGNLCTVQNPFTKWHNSSTDIIYMLIEWLLWSYNMIRIHNYNANPQKRLLPTPLMKRQILQTWGEITGIQLEVNLCCLPRNQGIIIMPKRRSQTLRQARSSGRTESLTGRRGITKATRRWADIAYLVVTIITSKNILSKNLQLFSKFILILS